MKEEGGDSEVVTGCLLPDSVQGDCFCISATPSGIMEGKEPSPSHHWEESSTLDLPSVCDLAERFLPPHSSENSEELFCSVDTFPSLPAGKLSCVSLHKEMQKNADDLQGRNLPCKNRISGTPITLLPISLETPGMFAVSDALCCPTESSCSQAVPSRAHSSGACPRMYPLGHSRESNLPSASPGSFFAGGSERANVRCYPKAGLCEPTEANDAAFSWMYEHDSAEDTSVRKSLDDFYKMYCRKRPDGMDPTYEAASRCLSQKISELANRDGTKYALRCLQMAQVVLNRDGCKIFPNHPTTACFTKPDEGEVVLEDGKKTPGLSDDVLQFLLKQTRTEHSPEASHEK